MKRLFALFAAGALLATVLAGSAAADPPTREVEDLAGEQIRCGDTLLTVTSGQFVGREHVHELRSGLFRVIFTGTARHVRMVDEDGTTYRAVGSAHATYTTPNPEQEGGEVGFFRVKITIVGKGGKLGTVDLTERTKRNGENVSVNRGNCEFVE